MSPHAYSMYNQTASENYFSQHEELKLIYTEDDQILMVSKLHCFDFGSLKVAGFLPANAICMH